MAEDGLEDRGRREPVRLLFQYPHLIAKWVGNELGIADFGPCSAIGVMEGDEIICGVVYNRFEHPNIEASIASTTPRWATRAVLRAIFHYPFNQLKVARLTTTTKAGNHSVRRFLERLGFVLEGTLRQAYDNDDAVIYGMLKSECRWIK